MVRLGRVAALAVPFLLAIGTDGALAQVPSAASHAVPDAPFRNDADVAYAALSFDIVCPASSGKLKLDYRAFFAVDPSHRCILVIRSRGEAATALLSPRNASVELRDLIGPERLTACQR